MDKIETTAVKQFPKNFVLIQIFILKIEPIYVENVEENLPPVTNEKQMPEQSEHQIGQNIIKVKFNLIQILR